MRCFISCWWKKRKENYIEMLTWEWDSHKLKVVSNFLCLKCFWQLLDHLIYAQNVEKICMFLNKISAKCWRYESLLKIVWTKLSWLSLSMWLHCVRSMDFFLEKILEIHSYFSMRITLDRNEGGCNHSLCISEDKDETSTAWARMWVDFLADSRMC